MKKKRIGVILLLLCVLMAGCGHKSKSELVDIEQFRCQDSIQTVFDVLGKAEIETDSWEQKVCRYKNVNLWGYDGEVVFKIRDDEDTIKEFFGYLVLNDDELEDVLLQFVKKYGAYKMREYSSGRISYAWEFEEEEAEEFGYSHISIQHNEDKNYMVDFWDEWSIANDEAYDEYLRELEEKESEEYKSETLADKTYNIGEDTFHFTFSEYEGEYQLSLFCRIEEKVDAFYTHIALNELMKSEDENLKILIDNFHFTYIIVLGDGSTLSRTSGFVLTMSADGEMVDMEEFFPIEELLSGDSSDSDYGGQVLEFFADFIETQ